jgi:hypothetical protein
MNKNWFGRHTAITYVLCVCVFLALVFIAYYFSGPGTCALVSFGLPGFAFAFWFGWENGRIDLLRNQQELENAGKHLKEANSASEQKMF